MKERSSSPPHRGKGGKPTLRTISELSGLAVPTVSRALSDAPDIGAATKTLVRKIAKEIGYVPNRAGVRLRTGRTNVISLVLSPEPEMTNVTAQLIYAIASGLRDTRYHLNVTPYFVGDDPLTPVRYIVETGSADAIIFNRVLRDDPRVDYLIGRGFPFAAHGRSGRAAEHSWCDFDNAAFADQAVRKFAARGRRNVLLIAPPLPENYAIEMLQGAKDAAHDTGLGFLQESCVSSDDGNDAIRDYIAERLATDSTIDCILTASPHAAIAAVAGIESRGRVVGGDIDLYSKEATPFLKVLRDGILVQTEDMVETGEFLARAAVHAARNPDAKPMQHLMVPGGI